MDHSAHHTGTAHEPAAAPGARRPRARESVLRDGGEGDAALPDRLCHRRDPRRWTALLGGFAVAFVIRTPVNRWMIDRGKGHAVVHAYPWPIRSAPRPAAPLTVRSGAVAWSTRLVAVTIDGLRPVH